MKVAVNPISTWIKEINGKKYDGLFELESGINSEGTKIIQEIFGEKIFDYPKPLSLIKNLIKQVTNSEESCYVLDSFAGTGTSAHAVLDLNKEDDGNRKFILVEMEDYADKITAERVRRVIKGVEGAKDEKLKNGLGGSFSYFELGKAIDTNEMLSGKSLPSFKELARYVFYTATGEEFEEKVIDEESGYIGETKEYELYLIYKPDLGYLKSNALTLDRAKSFGKYKGKKRIVFGPTKYLDQEMLDEYHILFAQLPFEIYRMVK